MTPADEFVGAHTFRKVLERVDEITQGDNRSQPHKRASQVARFRTLARETVSPVEYLITSLHPWVGFLIMPIFALANAGVPIGAAGLTSPVAFAAAAGLLVGKPLGIVLLSFFAVRIGLAKLPQGVSWGVLAAGGILAGIGFTMALFIAGLALDGELLAAAKVGILGASAVAAVVGTLLLRRLLPEGVATEAKEVDRLSKM